MCLYNYNKKIEKYKHLSYAERTMIERWYNKEKKSKKEISKLLGKSERTIRREINRGLVSQRDYLWREYFEYSAQKSQEEYKYNMTGKGPELKLDQDISLVRHIEKEIKENKKSPEAIVSELVKNGFDIEITGKTIRNTIKLGTVFDLSSKDMIYKKTYKNKNIEKRVSKQIPAEKSIEHRPKEANKRTEYGHWEGDLVVGPLRGSNSALFTLTERMTREEIIMKVPNKKTENISKSLNKIERKLGKDFYSKFKSITFDNGVEFMDYKGIEKSCLRKSRRTSIYYAHPYCSGERGTNENANRMIRRWIPKGTNIDEISSQHIKFIESWINNYPRAMFDYKSTNMILLNI